MKNYHTLSILILGLVLGFASISFATEGHEMAPYKGTAELERIKKLAGKWEGASNHSKEGEKTIVEYQVTAGDSAVVEKLMPGTPHEMISVYYDKGGRLAMTHYCMLANRPQMSLKKATPESYDFSLERGSGINVRKDPHMHALKITFTDADHIIENWTLFEKGKEKGVTTLTLARIK